MLGKNWIKIIYWGKLTFLRNVSKIEIMSHGGTAHQINKKFAHDISNPTIRNKNKSSC